MGKGLDYLKEPRSLFAVREGERRIRRSDPMELLEGASEWARRRKENNKSQRFSVRFSFLERLLVYRRKFTLISPAGLVKPFRTQIRRERLEVASMDAGGKIPGLVHKRGSKAMEPGHGPVPVAICLLHFLFLRSFSEKRGRGS